MQTIQTIGKFKVDKDLVLIDPNLSIESIYYNFTSMKATITLLMENSQYSHSRELDAIDFTNYLSNAEIKAAVQNEFGKKKV